MESTLKSVSYHRELIVSLHDESCADIYVVEACFEKWFHQCEEGFYIRDLDEIVELLDLMMDRSYVLVVDIMDLFFNLCAKPLMELKANERLSHKGMERIERFFAKLSCLWSSASSLTKIKLGKCFRCIANGGRDPTMLRSDYQEWVPDGHRLKVTDKKFLQTRLRESEALDCIVLEFLRSADLLNYPSSSKADNNDHTDIKSNNWETSPLGQTLADELEFYGVPRSFGRAVEPSNDEVSVAEESVADLSIEEGREDSSPHHSTINTGTTTPLRRIDSASADSPSKADSSPAVTRDLSQVMLELCLELSADPENGSVMCSLGICDGAVVLIDKDWRFNPRENRISFEVELLWNSLEFFLEQAKSENPSDVDDPNRRYLLKHEYMINLSRTVDVLKAVLNYQLHEGYRLADKELRNEVLIILTMLAEFPSAIGFFMRSELLNLLISCSCVEEMGAGSWPFFSKNMAKTRNFATNSDIDLEFKKGLWFIVSACLRSNDPDALLCFASSPLMLCMIQYTEFDSFDPSAHHNHNQSFDMGGPGGGTNELQQLTFSMESMIFNDDSHLHAANGTRSFEDKTQQRAAGGTHQQKNAGLLGSASSSALHLTSRQKQSFISTLALSKLREFQLLAITFLVHNAPKVMGEFERLDGPTKTVLLTLKYCRSDVTEHKSLVLNGLILLNRCLITSLAVRQFMNENNMIQTCLFLFGKSDQEETRSQAVRLISSLCSNNNIFCQRQLRGLDGITQLIAPVQSYVRNRKPVVGAKAGISLSLSHEGEEAVQDPLENPFGGEISILVVAILDCFSNAVVGNKAIEGHFADQEGIDTLLDLLETSPFVLRIQVLRLFADILNNSRLVTYANAWRSPKTLRSAAQVLCHSWLDEEVRLNGERKENGVICDVYNPFGNHQWPPALVNKVPLTAANERNNISATVHDDSYLSAGPEAQTSNTLAFNAFATSTTGAGLLATNNNKSVTVSKLATAILAGRNATQTNLPIDVCEQALQKDSRVVIASALKSLGVYDMYAIQDHHNPLKSESEPEQLILSPRVDDGGLDVHSNPSIALPSRAPSNPEQFEGLAGNSFDESNPGFQMSNESKTSVYQSSPDLGLTPSDRQVLSMARKYHALRVGDWWQEVKSHVCALGIVPIEADSAWMDAHLEKAFDAAQAVQLEQMELFAEAEQMRQESEDGFIDQILVKKNQQIKAEWLKRNAKNKGGAAPGRRR